MKLLLLTYKYPSPYQEHKYLLSYEVSSECSSFYDKDDFLKITCIKLDLPQYFNVSTSLVTSFLLQ